MEQSKAAKISEAILKNVAAGKSLSEAFNTVLGAGAYERLVSDLYDGLRAGKGGAK